MVEENVNLKQVVGMDIDKTSLDAIGVGQDYGARVEGATAGGLQGTGGVQWDEQLDEQHDGGCDGCAGECVLSNSVTKKKKINIFC